MTHTKASSLFTSTCGMCRLQRLKELTHNQTDGRLLAPGTFGQTQLSLKQKGLQVEWEVLRFVCARTQEQKE